MWMHASDDGLMEVLDGSAADRVLSHVASCGRCRARVDEARGALTLARSAAMPEPTPLYWDVLRREVARRVAGERQGSSPRPLWAAAALAAAALVAALAVVPRRAVLPPGAVSPAALPAWSALPPAEDDPGLPVLEHVAPAVVAAAPAAECLDLAECVAGLSDDESRALADELRHELAQGRSL